MSDIENEALVMGAAGVVLDAEALIKEHNERVKLLRAKNVDTAMDSHKTLTLEITRNIGAVGLTSRPDRTKPYFVR